MRITSEQRQIIVATAKEVFGGDSVVRLFGSRVDDSKRGGDIDVHIIARGAKFDDELRFLSKMDILLGEKVDLRVQSESPLLIDEIAIESGMILC